VKSNAPEVYTRIVEVLVAGSVHIPDDVVEMMTRSRVRVGEVVQRVEHSRSVESAVSSICATAEESLNQAARGAAVARAAAEVLASLSDPE